MFGNIVDHKKLPGENRALWDNCGEHRPTESGNLLIGIQVYWDVGIGGKIRAHWSQWRVTVKN